MNEREGRKRLILRIEKRNDCFEREIECVVYEMRMSGHGWLLLRRWINDDLYDRYWWVEKVRSEFEREKEIEWGLIEELLKWLSIGIEKWVSDWKLFSKVHLFFSSRSFFFVPHLHTPTSSFHTEPSISLSCCPPPWLWEWLCWWWLLFLEMTHKHFVTLFQVFVHWTRLVSLPHVVGVMTTEFLSLLHTAQPGIVLFLT